MIELRPVEEKDQAFMEKVYRSTREKELEITGWTELQKQAFVFMQYSAQLSEYKEKFPGAAFQLIVYKKKPAGRFYTWQGDNEIRLIDITLLPQFRGRGIGTFLLQDLINQSNRILKKISLHVEPSNPALKLYQQMGFIHIKNNGRHYYMERIQQNKS
ncbi:MAG: GNAT family N-acetyltransferase [Chitinophagaceae bacterium]